MAITINDTPEIVDFVLNKPAFKITSDASPVKLVGRFFIQEKTGDPYTQLPDVYLDPDSADSAVFYIDEIFREYFEVIELNLFTLSVITKEQYAAKSYYIEFYEWNGSVLSALNTSSVIKLLYGRLPYQDWPNHTFETDLLTNLNYLNNFGDKVNTWKTAKNYLYWLDPITGVKDIELRCTIYYTDKTTEDQTLDTYSNSSPQDVLIVPAGYTELDIGGFTPSKTVYRYDLGLYLTDNTQVGKTISYYIKNKPWWAQQFLFRNDYGVLEAVIAEGKETSGIKADIETSEKRTEYDYAATDFQFVQRIKSRTKPFTANIGPLSTSEAEHLEEMINDKFFKIGSTKFIPCNILSSELKTVDQSKDLQVIELKYQYAFNV